MNLAVNRWDRGRSRVAGGVAVAAVIGLFSALPATADKNRPTDTRRPDDVVYVESNIGAPNRNSLFAFRQHADGSLSMLPGSPFSTGGRGVFDPSLALGPFDSDQNIIVDSAHSRLFAVNSGSNSVAVFDIRPNGALASVKGSPFASGGVNPVSLGLSGGILTVVNKNEDPAQLPNNRLPNYTTLRVNPNGKLIRVPRSTFSVPQGSSPTQALITPQALTAPNSNLIFGADFLGGLLRSFSLRPNGRLSAVEAVPLPAAEFASSPAPPLPLGLAHHPRLPIVYVGFVTINRVGVYTHDAAGHLNFVRTVANSGQAVCWLTTNQAGTRLYTSNTADNTVSVYDTSDPLRPVEIQTVLLKGIGNAFQLTLNSRESYLYVVDQRAAPEIPLGAGNNLHVLRVLENGTLAETAASPVVLPVPPGTRSQGVVAL